MDPSKFHILFLVSNVDIHIYNANRYRYSVVSPYADVHSWINKNLMCIATPKIVSEYDQEILQSQTADNPKAPRGRAAQPSRDNRSTN